MDNDKRLSSILYCNIPLGSGIASGSEKSKINRYYSFLQAYRILREANWEKYLMALKNL